jgi:hypothetical protein
MSGRLHKNNMQLTMHDTRSKQGLQRKTKILLALKLHLRAERINVAKFERLAGASAGSG